MNEINNVYTYSKAVHHIRMFTIKVLRKRFQVNITPVRCPRTWYWVFQLVSSLLRSHKPFPTSFNSFSVPARMDHKPNFSGKAVPLYWCVYVTPERKYMYILFHLHLVTIPNPIDGYKNNGRLLHQLSARKFLILSLENCVSKFCCTYDHNITYFHFSQTFSSTEYYTLCKIHMSLYTNARLMLHCRNCERAETQRKMKADKTKLHVTSNWGGVTLENCKSYGSKIV